MLALNVVTAYRVSIVGALKPSETLNFTVVPGANAGTQRAPSLYDVDSPTSEYSSCLNEAVTSRLSITGIRSSPKNEPTSL